MAHIIQKEEYSLLKPLRNYDPFTIYIGLMQLKFRTDKITSQIVTSYLEHFWIGYFVAVETSIKFKYSYISILQNSNKLKILTERLMKVFNYYYINLGNQGTNIINVLHYTQFETIKLSPLYIRMTYILLNKYLLSQFEVHISQKDLKLLNEYLRYEFYASKIELKLLEHSQINIEVEFDKLFGLNFKKTSLDVTRHLGRYKEANPERLSIANDYLLEFPFLTYNNSQIPILNPHKRAKYTMSRYLRTNYPKEYENIGLYFEKFVHNIFTKISGFNVIDSSRLFHKSSGKELCDLIVYTEINFVIIEIKYTIFNDKDKRYNGINESLEKGISQLEDNIKVDEIKSRFETEMKNKKLRKLLISLDLLYFDNSNIIDYPSVYHIQFEELIKLLYFSLESFDEYFENRCEESKKYDAVKTENDLIESGMREFIENSRCLVNI